MNAAVIHNRQRCSNLFIHIQQHYYLTFLFLKKKKSQKLQPHYMKATGIMNILIIWFWLFGFPQPIVNTQQQPSLWYSSQGRCFQCSCQWPVRWVGFVSHCFRVLNLLPSRLWINPFLDRKSSQIVLSLWSLSRFTAFLVSCLYGRNTQVKVHLGTVSCRNSFPLCVGLAGAIMTTMLLNKAD